MGQGIMIWPRRLLLKSTLRGYRPVVVSMQAEGGKLPGGDTHPIVAMARIRFVFVAISAYNPARFYISGRAANGRAKFCIVAR